MNDKRENVIFDSGTSASMPGVLALADGSIFHGQCFGALRGIDKPITGEVVFNTSLFGYQEILTDPSYAGQIVTFTAPHIGNVGCNNEDDESEQMFAEGLIIRNMTKLASNFRATVSLSNYLAERGKMGIAGIDTRALVMHLRDNGSQMGVIAAGASLNCDDLIDKAKALGSMAGKDYVRQVSCKSAYSWNEGVWSIQSASKPGAKAVTGYTELSSAELKGRPHVVAVDCGIKYNILRLLVDVGFRVTVVPAFSTAADILAHSPDALFLSNGPGDPATLDYVVNPAKDLLGKLPIFGICLGHQILGQAFGGKTYKLKFGHRGGNHPVKDLLTNRVEITVQNHGFAVDHLSLPKSSGAAISHINLNDNTVEGLSAPDLNVFCVQYHPEASPGPHDSAYLFKRFYQMVTEPTKKIAA